MSIVGTRKVYWDEIKDQIRLANNEFFILVDKLNPGPELPLYVLNFPYGELIGDKISQFIPMDDNKLVRLTDNSLPFELKKDLGYGKSDSPMGMILEKQFEWFVDLPQKNLTLPVLLQKPGDFFSYTKAMDVKGEFNYSPMGVLSAISGARTVFMIPSIGCQTKLTKLCRELGIKAKQPHYMYDQFKLFKTILSSNQIDNSWRSSLIYFSENWINNIKTNPDWFHVQKYFYTIFAQKALYLKNSPHYQTAYSLLLDTTNQKPNPYLFDTFKHIVDIMTGETPGFAPQLNDELMPVTILQNIFTTIYGLKNTVPTLMGPAYLAIQNNYPQPIYYSLQYPTTRTFSPNSKKSSTMAAMRELSDMFIDMISELIKDNYFCSNTIIQHVAKNIGVSFFHNTDDIDGLIGNISGLLNTDERFSFTSNNLQGLIPAEDSKFFRGCIKIAPHE